MRETRFRDLILGDVILSFDGHVVELFGSTAVTPRIHRLMLAMQVSGPTERGNYVVNLSRTVGGGGVELSIAGNDWPNVEPLLTEISAALQQPGG
ncbi:MAG TPA: hypothetical protein VMQ81_06840 [Acidimicrobiia bacterium]|nr:hypothetical protein [Acidimicrobiia bacterium]